MSGPRSVAMEPRTGIAPIPVDELAELDKDSRQLEAWHLVMSGWSQRKVAERFDVSPSTIRNWIDKVAVARRTRSEDVDLDIERMIGQLEAVAMSAWEGRQQNQGSSMAGPSYLKIVVDAVQGIARLKGLDAPKTETNSSKQTTVVVKFGGSAGGGREQPIDVGVRVEELASA